MATGADVFRRNAGLIYNTYQTEFNRILETLIANERVTPGSITAAVNDLSRQEAALKNERDALERLRLEGQKSDAQLLATLQELKGRGAIASMEQATSASIARGKLRQALSEEVTGQRTAGRTDFQSASTSREIKALDDEGYFPTGGSEAEVQGDLQGLGKTYVETLMQGAPTDPIAAAQYRDQVLAKTKDYLFTRVQEGSLAERALGTGDMTANEKSAFFSSLAKRSAVQGGIDVTAPTPQQAEAEVRSELENIARQVRGGGDPKALSARAAVLGVSEKELQELSAVALTEGEERQAAEQQTGVDVVKRAAYYSSKLPGSEFKFASFIDYQNALENNDPAALELYNLTLKKNPSFIQLLSGGEYTARMASIANKERGIAARRQAYDDLVRQGRKPVDYERLYNEARGIYTKLFTGRGRVDSRRRAQEAQDAIRENPALAGALDEVLEEEGVSRASRDRTIRALSGPADVLMETTMAEDDDIDLQFTDEEAEKLAESDPQGLTYAKNEQGQVVLAGTDIPMTELTLQGLLEAVREGDTDIDASSFENTLRVYKESDRAGKARIQSGIKLALENLAPVAERARDIPTQDLRRAVSPPVPRADVPPATMPAPMPEPPAPTRESALLQPAIPAGTATEGQDMAYMSAGQSASVAGARAIADQTFNETVSREDFQKANKDVLRGAAQNMGIDERAIAATDIELAALEELGRVGGPNPSADQIADIVPEAAFNQGVLTYASMVARNAYDTKNIT